MQLGTENMSRNLTDFFLQVDFFEPDYKLYYSLLWPCIYPDTIRIVCYSATPPCYISLGKGKKQSRAM